MTTLSFSEPNQLAMLEITPEALSTAVTVTDLSRTLLRLFLALDVGPPVKSDAKIPGTDFWLTLLILLWAEPVAPPVKSDAKIQE